MNQDSMPIQPQGNTEETQGAIQLPKKPYVKPEVTILGTLVELTQAGGGFVTIDTFNGFS